MRGVITEGNLGTPHPKAAKFSGSKSSRPEPVEGAPSPQSYHCLGPGNPSRDAGTHLLPHSCSRSCVCQIWVGLPLAPDPKPQPGYLRATCRVVGLVIYVSLSSLWQLFWPPPPHPARPRHAQLPVQIAVRLPQNVVENPPSVLWQPAKDLPLETGRG